MATMQSPVEERLRAEGITRPIDPKRDLKEFRQHLKEVVEGAAFRGSHRSGQFLTYIVDQMLAGHLDALKERAIGVELFGRSPAYDTGEDAIVRVTASDVRKRLMHHYMTAGAASDFRITLLPGSYVPEITRNTPHEHEEAPALVEEPTLEAVVAESPALDTVNTVQADSPRSKIPLARTYWIAFAVGIAVLNIAGWIIVGQVFGARMRPTRLLPWSAFFRGQRTTVIVTSDPNIAEIQGLTGEQESVSDYANQVYIPHPESMSAEDIKISHNILRGDKAANVDIPAVAGVARLAAENASELQVRPARNLRFSDIGTEGNFIFLGSPRTNPWVRLFDNEVDFRFFYDTASRQEIIVNAHPHPGEARSYVPTAKGFATGQSFATISFVRNPDQPGQVLLLAGANAEGTEATGKLVTDLQSLSAVLQHCGIRQTDKVQHFQILLRLSMMAGSPGSLDVVTCHILP